MHPLDGITAADLMETEVLSLSPGDSVEDAILELEETGRTNGQVLGLHLRRSDRGGAPVVAGRDGRALSE